MAAPAPVARQSAAALLRQARAVLDDAAEATDPAERFCLAQLSALRSAAAALTLHARQPGTRRRLVSVWVRLDKLEKDAPEYAVWAAYFAAAARMRAAVDAGIAVAVSPRAADAQLRAAGEFLALVEGSLGTQAA